MSNRQFFTFATAAILAGTACSGEEATHNDGEGCRGPTPDTFICGRDTAINPRERIVSVNRSCAGDGTAGSDTWEFAVEVVGEVTAFSLDITETGAAPEDQWFEYGHTSDATLMLRLQSAGTTEIDGVVHPNTEDVVIATAGNGTTAFNCSHDDGQTLTFKVSISGPDSDTDCAVWGHNASELPSGDRCICFDC